VKGKEKDAFVHWNIAGRKRFRSISFARWRGRGERSGRGNECSRKSVAGMSVWKKGAGDRGERGEERVRFAISRERALRVVRHERGGNEV